MDVLVSIIIPVYQQEKWIGRCLQSVLDSSYHKCEIIVVNDGSTDKTGEIVKKYIEKTKTDGRHELKLINNPHGGPSRARNAGLRKAKGQFIGFMDADDMMDPKMIERLVGSMLKGNELAACGLQICDRDGNPSHWQYPLKAKHRQCPEAALELVLWEQILMSVSPVLLRRERIMDEQGRLLVEFPEELKEFEDFVFICRYLSRCDGFMEVIPFYGAFYCKRSGSLTTELHTVYELRQAMQTIVRTVEQIGGREFVAYKLQYAFRFMAFWYKEAQRRKKRDFSPTCEGWKVCMTELERYADVFMAAENVSFYKKLAMWIVRKHTGVGCILAKTVGRLVFGKH